MFPVELIVRGLLAVDVSQVQRDKQTDRGSCSATYRCATRLAKGKLVIPEGVDESELCPYKVRTDNGRTTVSNDDTDVLFCFEGGGSNRKWMCRICGQIALATSSEEPLPRASRAPCSWRCMIMSQSNKIFNLMFSENYR